MLEVSTMSMRDSETDEEAVVVVRHDTDRAALAISGRLNENVELVTDSADLKSLVDALQTALGQLS